MGHSITENRVAITIELWQPSQRKKTPIQNRTWPLAGVASSALVLPLLNYEKTPTTNLNMGKSRGPQVRRDRPAGTHADHSHRANTLVSDNGRSPRNVGRDPATSPQRPRHQRGVGRSQAVSAEQLYNKLIFLNTMTSRDFCFWLQGYFELNGELKNGISAVQTIVIRNHLALVFRHEIDPSIPDLTGELQTIHDGSFPNSAKMKLRC